MGHPVHTVYTNLNLTPLHAQNLNIYFKFLIFYSDLSKTGDNEIYWKVLYGTLEVTINDTPTIVIESKFS